MDVPSISQDDLMDVMEMAEKIEKGIAEILIGNEHALAMSSLMSASINSMLAQCKSLDQILFYRNLFVQILDISIKAIHIKDSEKPPSS